MKVTSIVGARPQFVKAAMVSTALQEAGIEEVLVHTGQHYDYEMSALLFEQLGLREPAYNLGVGSDSHGAQTARILSGVERVLLDDRPDMVIVYGDTNSTLAGALAATKLHIAVAHVEAGLRSFNRRMPEEINRVLTDHASDLLLVPTPAAALNLKREGIDAGKIVLTGDVMYDCVLRLRPLYEEKRDELLRAYTLERDHYFVATIHRAENTDDESRLRGLIEALTKVATNIAPVIWPIHPRTRKKLALLQTPPRLLLIEPVGYLEMQALLSGARGALTDSGGLQKEAAFHAIPTITLRDETEWVETVESGCNVLMGADPEKIVAAAQAARGPVITPAVYGDGHASRVIANAIRQRGSEIRKD